MHKRDKSRPFISDGEIIKEVCNRTNLSYNVVRQVLLIYFQVIKDCIEADVDPRLGILGTFTLIDYAPRKRTFYNCVEKKMVKDKFYPGFKKIDFIPNFGWRKEVKEKTLYWPEGTEPDEVEYQEEDNNA